MGSQLSAGRSMLRVGSALASVQAEEEGAGAAAAASALEGVAAHPNRPSPRGCSAPEASLPATPVQGQWARARHGTGEGGKCVRARAVNGGQRASHRRLPAGATTNLASPGALPAGCWRGCEQAGAACYCSAPAAPSPGPDSPSQGPGASLRVVAVVWELIKREMGASEGGKEIGGKDPAQHCMHQT